MPSLLTLRPRAFPAIAAIVGALILSRPAATAPSSDPFGVFRSSVALQPDDRNALDRSEAVIVIPPAKGRDLTVFSAIALDPAGSSDRMARWLRHIERLRHNQVVLGTRRLSAVPDDADLDAITLDDHDLQDIAECRPGRCGVKLSIEEIQELHAAIGAAGGNWRDALQRTFRGIVRRRVAAYLAGGHTALADVVDHRLPRSPSMAFARLAAEPPLMDRRVSDALAGIAACPAAFLGPDRGFLYWSKERLGGKSVIAVTHVSFVRPDAGSPLESVVVAVQVFATHYFEATLSVTAVVKGTGTRRYLVHVYRSEVDILEGFWGGVARSIIARRLKREGPPVIESVRQRLATVEPPEDRAVSRPSR